MPARARCLVSSPLVSIVILLGCAVPAALGQPQPPPGFTALFNGKDLTGWHGMPHLDPRKLRAMSPDEQTAYLESQRAELERHWRVANGELVNDGEGPYATTDEEYGDVELRIEYKTVPKADSGIYLRGNPQVQIWDYTQEGGRSDLGADKGSGGLWNNSPGAAGKDPLVRADKPFGEWNTLRIIQVGEITTVWLNDRLVVDHARMENYWDRKAPLPPTGPIQLQTHGGEIRWRNIFVRTIPADEANQYLAERNADSFESIFDGKTWAGWTGPLESYEITREGTIRCKPGEGGTIHTKREYADFVVRLQLKLPPAANNGLAIRYPGKGDAAYDGMSELQVLDNGAEKYADLDPRQFHGSAYGMVAARRGYQRSVGTWNFQQVTVQGSRIQVELNGTRILDADLATVTEFAGGRPHPGKNRKSGYFGFAGHNDPVEYRHVQIKTLP
ncbi:MAG: 3-keto-disaccharide hydrolase [Vicinamibacteraceae bacterium]